MRVFLPSGFYLFHPGPLRKRHARTNWHKNQLKTVSDHPDGCRLSRASELCRRTARPHENHASHKGIRHWGPQVWLHINPQVATVTSHQARGKQMFVFVGPEQITTFGRQSGRGVQIITRFNFTICMCSFSFGFFMFLGAKEANRKVGILE